MSLKYIYHHLGLGDHIICNGMVRHFCKKYDNIVVFCKDQYYENVSYMYRDLNNLEIFSFLDDQQVIDFINRNITVKNNLIKPGFENLDSCLDRMTFDEAFYYLAGLDFQIRFDEFYFERDLEKEEEVCKTLNPDGEKYIFVLDDPKRGYNIDMDKVTNEYKVIRNDYQFKMFDYIKLLENAEEIHTMQTGFLDMINSYQMNKPKIHRHNYVRNYPASIHSKGLNKVIEIN
jgi:hypothetical protein